MDLQLIGAGLSRTGTTSLKVALETLLDGPCYHMFEAFAHPEHVAGWGAALGGDTRALTEILDGYVACVDLPCAAFWRQLSEMAPQAPVLLSTRDSADSWWRSVDATILAAVRGELVPEHGDAPPAMITSGVGGRFVTSFITPDPSDRNAAIASYERHNDEVRTGVPADRLVEWQPGDGWEPVVECLGIHVPETPFPHSNTTAEFRDRAGLGVSRQLAGDNAGAHSSSAPRPNSDG